MKKTIIENNTIINGDSAEVLKTLTDGCIDLTVTSPPYDNLRTYNGFDFDFESIARELYRVTKVGGVVVWIVADATIDGSETGTSFKQALYFKSVGFNIHDTMIWVKETMSFPDATRYGQSFEYMFVLSKGTPKTVNKIRDRFNKWNNTKVHGTSRNIDGTTFRKANDKKTIIPEYGERFNTWNITTEKNNKTGHPAVFPVHLVKDHLISWSNKGDTVLDPFLGSGTTAVACIETGRKCIGIEISKEYCDLAIERIEEESAQIRFL